MHAGQADGTDQQLHSRHQNARLHGEKSEHVKIAKRNLPVEGIMIGKRDFHTEGILLGRRDYPMEGVMLGRRDFPEEGIMLGKRNFRLLAQRLHDMNDGQYKE